MDSTDCNPLTAIFEPLRHIRSWICRRSVRDYLSDQWLKLRRLMVTLNI